MSYGVTKSLISEFDDKDTSNILPFPNIFCFFKFFLQKVAKLQSYKVTHPCSLIFIYNIINIILCYFFNLHFCVTL